MRCRSTPSNGQGRTRNKRTDTGVHIDIARSWSAQIESRGLNHEKSPAFVSSDESKHILIVWLRMRHFVNMVQLALVFEIKVKAAD